MKKSAIIILTLILAIGFTACKKGEAKQEDATEATNTAVISDEAVTVDDDENIIILSPQDEQNTVKNETNQKDVTAKADEKNLSAVKESATAKADEKATTVGKSSPDNTQSTKKAETTKVGSNGGSSGGTGSNGGSSGGAGSNGGSEAETNLLGSGIELPEIEI